MAEAVLKNNEGLTQGKSGMFGQAGTLVSQVSRIYAQPAFQRSMPTVVAFVVAIVGLLAYVLLQQPS